MDAIPDHAGGSESATPGARVGSCGAWLRAESPFNCSCQRGSRGKRASSAGAAASNSSNFKADAQSTVQAVLDCEVGINLRRSGFTTKSGRRSPKVNAVHLALVDVDLQRVSRLDGPAAQELGDRLRPRLEHELQGRETEVAQKLNAAIEQHRDRLHYSTAGLFTSGWEKAQSLFSTFSRPAAPPPPEPPKPAAPESPDKAQTDVRL